VRTPPAIDVLRASIRRIEAGAREDVPVLPFGVATLDGRLPGGGLPLGALHEVAGSGAEVEHGAAAALFVAGIVARLPGAVLWCVLRPDLFAPALAQAGLEPARVICVEGGRGTLAAMEDGLRQRGLAGVVGETDGRVGLVASRRLNLAAETAGQPDVRRPAPGRA
jgi:protein ImuA